MSIPGFTAEATLYRMGDQNYIGSGAAAVTPALSQGIVPQNYPPPDPPADCDMYFVCVNGKRYLKRDCPDGSGDTTWVGWCPSPKPWWWLFTAISPYHHWF